MIRIARNANVPVIVVNPVSNLKDSPPFKTQHREDLTATQIDEFERLWEAAKATSWKQAGTKVNLLKRALAIDDRHADAHFLLATCYHQIGLLEEAKAAYIRAKEEDVCPLRILEPMHDVILQVARQYNVPLVDVRQLFEDQSKDGIPGDLSLIDHVHPRIDGHQLIARALLAELQRQRIVAPKNGWEVERDKLYAERFQSLAPNYFPESVARLDGLRRWTQGRVSRVGAPSRERTKTSIQTGESHEGTTSSP